MDQSHGAPATSEPSPGAPAAVLRRAWLDVAAGTAPQLPDLPALLDARLAELEATGPVDEPSLLAIVEEASNHALEQGGADVARSLSKRLRRAIYEFLLALDAVHPAELAAMSAPVPAVVPALVDAPSRAPVAFMPEDVSGADDTLSVAVAEAPAAAVPMWEALAPPAPAREVYRVATREMEPVTVAGGEAAGQDAAAGDDVEDAVEAAWAEAHVAEVVEAVETQVDRAWQQEEEIVAAAPVEADVVDADGAAVWTELSGERQPVVYDTAAADVDEGVAALPFVGDAALVAETELVDASVEADAIDSGDAGVAEHVADMVDPVAPETNGASRQAHDAVERAELQVTGDAPALESAPPAQNGHRSKMAPRDLLRVPRQFRRVPPGAEDLHAEPTPSGGENLEAEPIERAAEELHGDPAEFAAEHHAQHAVAELHPEPAALGAAEVAAADLHAEPAAHGAAEVVAADPHAEFAHDGAAELPAEGSQDAATDVPEPAAELHAEPAELAAEDLPSDDAAAELPAHLAHDGAPDFPDDLVHDGAAELPAHPADHGAPEFPDDLVHDGAAEFHTHVAHDGAPEFPDDLVHDGAAEFPAHVAHDGAAELPAEPGHPTAATPLAAQPTPAWVTPPAATSPERPAWSAEPLLTTELPAGNDDDLFGVPSVPWGADRADQAPAAAADDDDDDAFGIPFAPLADLAHDNGLADDVAGLPRPPAVAEEPLYPPPGTAAQQPAPWEPAAPGPHATQDPYALELPAPAATPQPFPTAAHDPYAAPAHDPYGTPPAPDRSFGAPASTPDATQVDAHAAGALPWGPPPATPFPIAPREGFHLTDAGSYDAHAASPQPAAAPPDDFHLTDPRAFEPNAPALTPAENPFTTGFPQGAAASPSSQAAAAPLLAEPHDIPDDENSWRIRQSPRAQLLAERMAQKRREEAARAAFDAASVVNEPERKSKRKRGDDDTPDLPTARRQLDEHLRKKRGAEAGALLQRLAQGLGGREIADLAVDAGDRCRALGQSRSATNCYLAAWRADPLYETPLWRLSDICLNDQEIDLAVGYLERIAELMRSRGDDEGAIGVYRKIAMIAPERQDVRDVIRLAKTTGRLDG